MHNWPVMVRPSAKLCTEICLIRVFRHLLKDTPFMGTTSRTKYSRILLATLFYSNE